jgi:tetratricopeptide (TPR) repeat protein
MLAMPLPTLLSLARQHPGSEAVYYTLGLKLMAEGRYYEAVTALDQAITNDRRSARSLDAAGRVLARARQYDDAAQYFEGALRLDPESLPTRRALAVLYEHTQKLAPAVRQYEAIVTRRPDDAESWAHLAECLLPIGRAHDAVAAIGRAVQLNPGNEAYRLTLRRAMDQLYTGARR